MAHDLRRRLARLEWAMHAPPGSTLIRIYGGLPEEDGAHASAGLLRFWRQPNEDQAAFEDRVMEASEAEPFVVFGVLGASEEEDGNLQ